MGNFVFKGILVDLNGYTTVEYSRLHMASASLHNYLDSWHVLRESLKFTINLEGQLTDRT